MCFMVISGLPIRFDMVVVGVRRDSGTAWQKKGGGRWTAPLEQHSIRTYGQAGVALLVLHHQIVLPPL